ncbi:acyltransferase family protein [Phaeovulum sp. W22_SRMD_FR3]|uniref:acyltransferase family protein n=1 Tax=Phaeovulum sp. W22_SRMD_FR3 TaxID=3240274 RepID=UPI003F9CC6CC
MVNASQKTQVLERWLMSPRWCLPALAVVWVALVHSSEQIGAPLIFRPEAGNFGVDIFFVISGFIMVYTSEMKRQSAVKFMLDRIARIVPNYWFFTLLMAAGALIAPSLLRNSEFGVTHLIMSMFFMPHVNPATLTYSPLLRLGWTLNMEMMFYALFAIGIAISFRRRVVIAAGLVLAVFLASLAATLLFASAPAPLQFWSQDILLEFILGMAAGKLFFHNKLPVIPAPFAWALIVLSLVAAYGLTDLVVRTDLRGIFWGPLAVAIIVAGLSLEPKRAPNLFMRTAGAIGNASYSIYLSHIFVFTVARVAWKALKLPATSYLDQAIYQTAVIGIAFVIGYYVYRWVETPLTHIARYGLRGALGGGAAIATKRNS